MAESGNLTVALAIPSGGKTHIVWAHMYRSLQFPVSMELNTLSSVKVPIATARQNMAQTCIDRGLKYLIFLDDDVLVPQQAFRRMIYQMENNPEWDALSGIYVTKTAPPEPLIFGGEFKDGTPNVGTYWDWRMGETFPIWGAGLGCCIIRVSAFDKIESPYFAWEETNDGKGVEKMGEDLYFFRKLHDAGGVVMADGAVLCGHMDRDSDKVFSMWRDSLPFKNAIPEFLADPLAGFVPDHYEEDVVTKREAEK